MTLSKARKLRREVEALRRGTPNVGQLQRLARRLGRQLTNRGKEPTWVNRELPELRPLSIPNNPSTPRPTKQSIVDELEGDLFGWEEKLGSTEKE